MNIAIVPAPTAPSSPTTPGDDLVALRPTAITMKIAKGSGKATLPGHLQVHRFDDHDIVALADEPISGGRPLLQPVWRGRGPSRELPSLSDSRNYVRDQIESLPPRLRTCEVAKEPWKLIASDGLVAKIEELVKEAGL